MCVRLYVMLNVFVTLLFYMCIGDVWMGKIFSQLYVDVCVSVDFVGMGVLVS